MCNVYIIIYNSTNRQITYPIYMYMCVCVCMQAPGCRALATVRQQCGRCRRGSTCPSQRSSWRCWSTGWSRPACTLSPPNSTTASSTSPMESYSTEYMYVMVLYECVVLVSLYDVYMCVLLYSLSFFLFTFSLSCL